MASPFRVALTLLGLVAAACGTSSVMHGAPRPADSTTTTTTVPPTTVPPTTATVPPRAPPIGLAAIPPGGAAVYTEPGGDPAYKIHEGTLLGFESRDGDYLEALSMCSDTVWVRESDVELVERARGAGPPGQADLARATIVIDPGHGARDWGGVGPTGLAEKEANLDISVRLRELLLESHDIAWNTGEIVAGDAVPAVDAVWLTRDPAGAAAGDYELSLAYRSHVANTAGADVFVSIHNNTVPTADPDEPGTEVFYAWSVAESDRLASLIHQEMLLGFRQFDADWKGGLIRGARTRIDPDTDTDYYGILRRATMPAVIVEGVYISEPAEEALLRTAAFRQAYAAGVYRGIVRFLTTPESGTDVNEPELFTSDAGTVNTAACEVPRQPQ